MLEIYVNGQILDLFDDTSLNLQENIFNPTEVTTKQSSYSYNFTVPCSDRNSKILGHWNVLESTEKTMRFNAEVYSDSTLIFSGSLVVSKFSDNKFTLNLVSVKTTTYSEQLKDKKLSDVDWEIPFEGCQTINQLNADANSKVFFPLVNYGPFQKKPYYEDEVASDYTSKFLIDKYNKWWYSSFYPSLNVLELAKKCLEGNGFIVGGSAFDDPILKNIYMSTSLASEQVPTYNLGNPKFGHIKATASFDTSNITSLIEELGFPYFGVRESMGDRTTPNSNPKTYYNLEYIDFFNLLENSTVESNSYLYDSNESVIVIPSDGWYKISLSASTTLVNPSQTMSCPLYVDYYQGNGMTTQYVTLPKSLQEHSPIEIQLVRNVNLDENKIELIKGSENVKYLNGNPNEAYFNYKEGEIGYRQGGYLNRVHWKTEFPHENLYNSDSPTETGSIMVNAQTSAAANLITFASRDGSTTRPVGGGRATSGVGDKAVSTGLERYYSGWKLKGYLHSNTHVFDPGVTNSFICGLSSFDGGIPSIMRNGRSWSKLITDKNDVFSFTEGYKEYEENRIDNGTMQTRAVSTNYNKNDWNLSPRNYCTVNGSSMSGMVECCIWLNRNDILELVAVQRDYQGKQLYAFSGNVMLEISAISPKNRAYLEGHDYNYNTPSQFPYNLQLGEFLDKEMDMSEYIESVAKAFNLEILQDGKAIDINTQSNISNFIHVNKDVVEIDDRASRTSSNFEQERISWPKSLSVSYKVNEDEFGFQESIPLSRRGDEDANEYGDSGYTKMILTDDIYADDPKDISTKFSYTWYGGFTFQQLDASGETLSEKEISIPVIIKDEYMIDKTYYEDDLKQDGFSLTPRFWFRQSRSTDYIYTYDKDWKEQVYLTYPTNSFNGVNLSYKTSEPSLLRYFTMRNLIGAETTNVEVRINGDEFNRLKGGSLVRFNNDLYYTQKVQYNAKTHLAKLTLMKKVD